MRRMANDHDAWQWNVYLDGVLLKFCVEADDVEGYAVIRDEAKKQEIGEGLPTRIVYGKVEFKREENT